jgi:Branched-chain amino acid ABC-type transport system, permease components
MEITNIFFIIFLSLQIGLIYGLIALGFNLLYSSTRIINITYGDFITLSGYITFWLYSLYNISPFLSLGISSFFFNIIYVAIFLYFRKVCFKFQKYFIY